MQNKRLARVVQYSCRIGPPVVTRPGTWAAQKWAQAGRRDFIASMGTAERGGAAAEQAGRSDRIV